MAQILVPTTCAEDWKRLLAKPDLHWKAGYSAMTLAHAWESARIEGFPPEVRDILATAGRTDWRDLRLLIAIPEYQVVLPGGRRASQTDLVALARGDKGLVAIAIEGKVDESLGPTLGEKQAERSDGVERRVEFLLEVLALPKCPDKIRYQLLHRTVSALLIAKDFAAESAVMLVHSFSPRSKWLEDFRAFARLLGADAEPGRLVFAGARNGIPLYIGWCAGDQRFRAGLVAPAV